MSVYFIYMYMYIVLLKLVCVHCDCNAMDLHKVKGYILCKYLDDLIYRRVPNIRYILFDINFFLTCISKYIEMYMYNSTIHSIL